jgi:PAS domain-containing protein
MPPSERTPSEEPAPGAQQGTSHEMLLAVLDSLDAVVYVADIETYEILFLNEYARKLFGESVGKTCWQTLQQEQTGPCAFCTNKHLIDDAGQPTGMYAWEFQNTFNSRWYDIRDRAIRWPNGRVVRLEIATDITERKQGELERERLLEDVREALARVKTLSGLFPICAACKKIRDDEGYWNQIEFYIEQYSDAEFTHSICPDCSNRLYGDLGNK